MLPIIIDVARVSVAVAGRGPGLERRLALLEKAGISSPKVISENSAAGLSGIAVLFVAGIGETESMALVQAARAAGVLVNVEDRPALCDFHVPAQLRRGDLLITVSTAGRAPGLSRGGKRASRLRLWPGMGRNSRIGLGSTPEMARPGAPTGGGVAKDTRHDPGTGVARSFPTVPPFVKSPSHRAVVAER